MDHDGWNYLRENSLQKVVSYAIFKNLKLGVLILSIRHYRTLKEAWKVKSGIVDSQ